MEALFCSVDESLAASGSLSSRCERSASSEAVLAAADGVGGPERLTGQVPAQRGARSVDSVGVAVGTVWAGPSGTAAPEAASPAVWDEREEDTRGLQEKKRQTGCEWNIGQADRQGRQQVHSDRAAKNVTLSPILADGT